MISQTPKDERLHIRIGKQERALLERAAQLEGKSLSAFLIQAGVNIAEEVLNREQTVQVQLETYQRFVAALESEPQVKTGLLEQIQKTQVKLGQIGKGHA